MNDGGSAFPTDLETSSWRQGMSLRDYFAAAALQGMLSNSDHVYDGYDGWALEAYAYADAMLEQRK